MAGHTAAGLALLSAIQSNDHVVAQANAAQYPQQAVLVSTAGLELNLTSVFTVLAVVLLVVSNNVLWRQRKGSELLRARSLEAPAVLADRCQRAKFEVEQSCQEKARELARISHELRTPLNAVIGFSDLMRRELFGPLGHDKYIEYAEHIGESGQNLLSAVDDIFELTNDHGDRQNNNPVDLSALIDAFRATEEQDVKVLEEAS